MRSVVCDAPVLIQAESRTTQTRSSCNEHRTVDIIHEATGLWQTPSAGIVVPIPYGQRITAQPAASKYAQAVPEHGTSEILGAGLGHPDIVLSSL